MRGVKAKQLRKASVDRKEYRLFKNLYRKRLYRIIAEMILTRGKTDES